MQTLIAGMAADPLPEAVTVAVFMEGLQTGVALTEVFRARPTSSQSAVEVAWNGESNFKSSRLGFSVGNAYPLECVTPMDLSYAQDDEAELQAAGKHRDIRRCSICRCTPIRRPSSPRLRHQTPSSVEELTSPTRPHISRYVLDTSLLTYTMDGNEALCVVIPADDDLRVRIAHEYHDTALGGHLGRKKTFDALALDFCGLACTNGFVNGFNSV